MRRSFRVHSILFCWLLYCSLAFGESYQAQDESLHTFFTALSVPLGQPVVVSQAVARMRVSGVFEFAQAQQVLERVAREQDLIWFDDGHGVYLYAASEAKSAVVALRHLSVERLQLSMRRFGLDETRHPLRREGTRLFYVSGPPRYVDQVQRLAQLMDRPKPDLTVDTQRIGVVQIFNTHVADRQYDLGGKTVKVPGMVTLLENLLADNSISLLAYPDTNSLLIKGKPAQVQMVENLVAQLDVPKRAVEISLWWVDLQRKAFKALKLPGDPAARALTTRVLAPLEDNAFMAHITALEKRRWARVSVLPVILGQENVPAVFHDNHTDYLPGPADEQKGWRPVMNGTQVSVIPRFAEWGEIEMMLRIEDGRSVDGTRGAGKVVRTGIDTVVRVKPGRRLLVGDFQREGENVRLFVLQARVVTDDVLKGEGGPPPLTASQYEQVKRAFKRVAEPG